MFYFSRALETEERALKFSRDLKSLPCERIHANVFVLLKLLFVVLQKVAVQTRPKPHYSYIRPVFCFSLFLIEQSITISVCMYMYQNVYQNHLMNLFHRYVNIFIYKLLLKLFVPPIQRIILFRGFEYKIILRIIVLKIL